ncbi:hypothetical protein Tco_0302434, partial [Tanacetum coccineum]
MLKALGWAQRKGRKFGGEAAELIPFASWAQSSAVMRSEREVLGLSPNVGLEALAESLNIPEGSQDKDSLKVLTELPRSQSMKVLALLVGSLVIVVMKNEQTGRLDSKESADQFCVIYGNPSDIRIRS